MKRDFYMDDFFTSVDLVTTAIKHCKKLVELCQRRKFRLTKWICNDRSVIDV